jgi:hypothetical protein
MISYSDFEFAIARWKSRAAGIPQPAPQVASGTVAAEVPVSTAPEDSSLEESQESGVVATRAATPVSGNVVLNDALLETPIPESDPR